MSDTEKQQPVTSVAGNIQKKGFMPHFKLDARMVVFIIAALVSTVVVAFLIVLSLKNNHAKPVVKPTLTADQQSASLTAIGQAADGNYDGAQKMLDEQITPTTSAVQQGILYEDKANLAIDNEKYDQALQFAKKAEELNPNRNSALLIARSAELKGDKTTALQYYKIVLERSTNNLDDTTSSGIKEHIKVLGG